MTGYAVINIIEGREMTQEEFDDFHDKDCPNPYKGKDVVVSYYGEHIYIGKLIFKNHAPFDEAIKLKSGWILIISEEYDFPELYDITGVDE